MLLTNVLALGGLAGSTFAAPSPARRPPPPASYLCVTSAGSFRIQPGPANAATSAPSLGGFPHGFGGTSGAVQNGLGTSQGSPLRFFGGANPICNQAQAPDDDDDNQAQDNPPLLSEYPVMQDGSAYPGRVGGNTLTPARAIFITATGELCGVVTHWVEDPNTHVGSGPFRVCDAN